MKQTLSAQDRILDISVNLARIGNWTADSYKEKKHLIDFFIKQTTEYFVEVFKPSVSSDVQPVLRWVRLEFDKYREVKINKNNKDLWAERALTWANILQHRAKLA